METVHEYLAVAMAIVLVPVSFLFNSNLTFFNLTGQNA